MADSIIWNGLPGEVSGSTSFGYFDNDASFRYDAKSAAIWAARRLGYPSMDVELDSGSFYSCYEEAVLEYSAQILQFTARENMMSLIGSPNSTSSSTYVNYTNKPISPNLERMITISDQYGSEVGVGGNVTWKKSYITIEHGQQDYDLNALIAEASESGNAIEIKRVYHFEPIAYGYGLSGVYNAPGVLGSAGQIGTYGLLGDFGWEGLAAGGIATGLSYTLMPVYEDLLRMQAVEFNFQMRRSGYSFEIRNNQLRIFPVPLNPARIWIEYVVKKEKLIGTPNSLTGSNYNAGVNESVTTNIGDAPFTVMDYNKINAHGKRWISKYFLACSRHTLGEIRSKYQTIPIPGSELILNGDALKQDATAEKETLITQLREDLERTSMQTQLQIQADIAENTRNVLTKLPQGIFVG